MWVASLGKKKTSMRKEGKAGHAAMTETEGLNGTTEEATEVVVIAMAFRGVALAPGSHFVEQAFVDIL